jgi:tetratricopeptide (TPR) repeat protein
MKKYVLGLVVITLLLAACSSNQRLRPQSQSSSRPNHSSMYFYMAANLQFLDGYYENAWTLYQRALNHDPGSGKIKKELLMSAMYHHLQQPSADADKIKNLVNSNKSFISEDDELLDAAYGFYSALRDTSSQRWALDTMLENHPSARAHVLNFLYSYTVLGKPDTSLLHPALDYIQNDIKQLQYLGSMFEAVDPLFSLKAAQRLYEIDPDEDTAYNFARLYLKTGSTESDYAYFDGLSYPKDRQIMHYILDAALAFESWDFLNRAALKVLDTKDNLLIYCVTAAAFVERNTQVLTKLENSFLPDDTPESGYITSLLVANSFLAKSANDLTPLLDSISRCTDLENIVRFYMLAYNYDLPEEMIPWDSICTEFVNLLNRELPEGPKREYLIATTQAIPDQSPEAEARYNQAKEELIKSFMQQDIYDKDDLAWILQHYFFSDRKEERIPLLRIAIREFPDQAVWFNDLGYTLLIMDGDLDEAGELIFKALSMEPHNNYFLDSIAWYFYLKKDYHQALNYISPVMEMEDMPAEIAYHIGLIHMRLADFDTATHYMKYASERTEEDPEYSEKAKRSLELWGN